jgi:peroxiredoxin
VKNQVDMLADWNGEFTKAVGMNVDLSGSALGLRSKRFVMVVDDGNIIFGDIENSTSECKVTAAESVLKMLEEAKTKV